MIVTIIFLYIYEYSFVCACIYNILLVVTFRFPCRKKNKIMFIQIFLIRVLINIENIFLNITIIFSFSVLAELMHWKKLRQGRTKRPISTRWLNISNLLHLCDRVIEVWYTFIYSRQLSLFRTVFAETWLISKWIQILT